MLSRTLRIPAAHRLGAVAAVLAVVVMTFTPIRFVAANESDAARKAYEDAKRLEEKQALAAAEGERGPSKRSPLAYMIKIRGENGTRGSVDGLDMDAARRLDDDNQTAVYFRLGEEMWISRDATTIRQVEEALAPEDRLLARQRSIEERNGHFEREQAKLEVQRAELDQRREELFRRRDALREEIDRHESDRSVEDLRREVGALQAEADEVSQRMLDLARSYDVIHSGMKSQYQANKLSNAEMQRVHEQVMESIGRIARRAVQDGRAVPFQP